MATRFAFGGPRRPASAWLALRAAPVFHNELDALSVPSYFVSTRAHAADSDETFGPRAPRGSSHIARCRSPSMCSFMVEREADRVLAGRIEIDDVYLGGECSGTPGRGSANKIPFVIAVETNGDGHPLFIKLSPTPFTKTALAAWSEAALDREAYVLTDGLGGFRGITGTVTCHHRIIVGSGRAAVQHPEFRWVNTILGNLKTAINGTYHAFDFAKYATRYLAEVQYRFNRRFDLRAILGCLTQAAVATAPWPEPKIRLAEVHR